MSLCGDASGTGPDPRWVDDWMVGVEVEREREVGRWLVEQFSGFWVSEGLDRKSKSTRGRYSGSLHALGGYLLKRGVSEDHAEDSAQDLLWDAIDPDEGPMIFDDHEVWQEELDRTCRRLYKYLLTKGGKGRSRAIDTVE